MNATAAPTETNANPSWGAPPIEDYGLLGDTRTAALVSSTGGVDWLCAPRFDSPPIFGRLVGGPDAGTFQIGPASPATVCSRRYRPESVTIETTWHTNDGGRLLLTEGFVGEVEHRFLPNTLLVRRVTALDNPVNVTVLFDPRRGDAHRRPRVAWHERALVCSWGPTAIGLRTTPPLMIQPGVHLTVAVEPGRPLTLALSVTKGEPVILVDPDHAWAELESDTRRWQQWAAGIDHDVPHHDMVVRSLLTLRLLTYSPSGAPVAAATTSLPEQLGGSRNWDYRYSWPRDASIGIAAYLALDQADEARRFLAWLVHATRLDRPRLPALLTLHGRPVPTEQQPAGWAGYRNSTPVRFGNGAADQDQLDGYGWVIDAAWNFARNHGPLNGDTWRAVASFADYVAGHWREPDAGIWEERGAPTHHVHSKAMAWLALDRAIRIADLQKPSARRTRRAARWRRQRDDLQNELTAQGYDEQHNTYTRTYGSTDLDAALLVLPLLELEPADSPRLTGTVDAIRDELGAGGPLLYRYPPHSDGLNGEEGAFLPCSFWLAQALATTHRHSEAAEVFDQLIALANPLGLYAEELDPDSGRFLGNFPQALTHAALIQAALALRDHRRDQPEIPVPAMLEGRNRQEPL